jgi:DNA-binding beta-propeller fold protein YncE
MATLSVLRRTFLVLTIGLGACSPGGASGRAAALVLERTIPLADVKGRIDHLAVDPVHGRLFVAALGAGAVEAVDLSAGRVAGRITGLAEPQGLALVTERQELVVATGGDGSVRFYGAADLVLHGQVALGEDADNVRFDPAAKKVVVGYGSGALAVIDPATRAVVSRTLLPAHPEGFQLDGGRAYVNLPDAGAVGVADLTAGKLVATWPNRGRRLNFPLAVDRAAGEVGVVYRLPARLVTFDPATGAERQALATCGDADDLFFDAKRRRAYVACGSGHVDVFERNGAKLERRDRVATSRGARTALFSPDLDRLFVAARAQGGRPAAILVFRPQ